MKNLFFLTALLITVLGSSASACGNNNQSSGTEQKTGDKMETMKIRIKVGSKTFTATLADNKSAQEFKKMLPLTLEMADHLRNEKHTDLSKSLPTNSSNPHTIENGDLMLFGSRTLVLFYKTFTTSYSYTRLGKVNDATGLASALGSGDVTVTFELEKL
ncbi:MAG: cyclophilin-like fold protein [Sphingobacterium sp.]